MRHAALILSLAISFLVHGQTSGGTCSDPPCAPAYFITIDVHSGQGEVCCEDANGYNCVTTVCDDIYVPVKDLVKGTSGRAEFVGPEGKLVKFSFTSYDGITAKGNFKVLRYSGIKVE